MALALASYDPARVHGYRLSRADLGRQIARLGAATQAERERMIGLDPRRADVILGGRADPATASPPPPASPRSGSATAASAGACSTSWPLA